MRAAKQGAELLRSEAEDLKIKRLIGALKVATSESRVPFQESSAQKVFGSAVIEQFTDSEPMTDVENPNNSGEDSSDSSVAEGQQCHCGITVLETVPATPLGATSLLSPPGLSRAAMHQARDALKADKVSVLSYTGSAHTTTSTAPR
jgi:hypothetical protein